jgi:ceramide glucosyltransferase
VVGKTMALTKTTLAEAGGWERLGAFLAEDQACGEAVASLGRRVAVSGVPVVNVLGRLSLRDACRRHVRWARIRSRISPAGYAAELLLNPVGVALLGVLSPSRDAFVTLGLAWAGMSALAAGAQRRLGQPVAAAPVVELLRAALVLALWPAPLFSGRVTWRGREFRIARRSRLVPLAPDPVLSDGPLLETLP